MNRRDCFRTIAAASMACMIPIAVNPDIYVLGRIYPGKGEFLGYDTLIIRGESYPIRTFAKPIGDELWYSVEFDTPNGRHPLDPHQ